MSNDNPKTENVSVITEVPAQETEKTEPKLGFFRRSGQFIKDHKRPAIAVGALVGLVGLAAVAGRKTASPELLVLSEAEIDELAEASEVQETEDTTVA